MQVPCGDNIAVTLTDVTPMKAREDELVAVQHLAQTALDDKVGLLHALGQKVPGVLMRILQRLDDATELLSDNAGNDRFKFDLAGARAEAAALSTEVDALVNLRQSAGFAYLGENYLSVLEISPNLSAVVRAEDGTILFLNGVGRQILGIPEGKELSGTSFLDYVPTDYSVLFEAGMSTLRGEVTRVPMYLESTDGHLVDVELLAMDCPVAGIDAWAGQDLVLVSAVDTTCRNRASRRIIAREEQLRKIMDNVADAVVVVDEDGRIETINRATETTFGAPSCELVGAGEGRLLGPVSAPDGRPMTGLETFLGGGVPARVSGWRRHLGRRADGELFPIEFAVRDHNLGERHMFIGLIRDISERVAYEENFLYMATHDLLTTLANRIRFHDELGATLVKPKREDTRFGLLFFDLDHFKAINDSFGHLVGDRILSVFARRLHSGLGDRARLSADEFVAIVENSGGPSELLPLANRIGEAVKKPMPAARSIRPALRNEMVITETKPLDCVRVVATMPKPRLRQGPLVKRLRRVSSVPPVNAEKPSFIKRMPNRKIAISAASCAKAAVPTCRRICPWRIVVTVGVRGCGRRLGSWWRPGGVRQRNPGPRRSRFPSERPSVSRSRRLRRSLAGSACAPWRRSRGPGNRRRGPRSVS